MNRKWHQCDLCGKTLSSYKCLWRHKKKFHEIKYNLSETSVDQSSEISAEGDDSEDFPTEAGRDNSEPQQLTDIPTYTWRDDGSIKKNHSILLPRDIRAIIIGKSGFGKTTLLTNLLLEPDMVITRSY